jgi:hypothetical protein
MLPSSHSPSLTLHCRGEGSRQYQRQRQWRQRHSHTQQLSPVMKAAAAAAVTVATKVRVWVTKVRVWVTKVRVWESGRCCMHASELPLGDHTCERIGSCVHGCFAPTSHFLNTVCRSAMKANHCARRE